jgi:hypothetical protein
MQELPSRDSDDAAKPISQDGFTFNFIAAYEVHKVKLAVLDLPSTNVTTPTSGGEHKIRKVFF